MIADGVTQTEPTTVTVAGCAIGFDKNAMGSQGGIIYVVTDSSDDDPTDPKPGTLRHVVIQEEQL